MYICWGEKWRNSRGVNELRAMIFIAFKCIIYWCHYCDTSNIWEERKNCKQKQFFLYEHKINQSKWEAFIAVQSSSSVIIIMNNNLCIAELSFVFQVS